MRSTAIEAGFDVHDTEPKSIRAARIFECLGIIINFNLKQLRMSEGCICEIHQIGTTNHAPSRGKCYLLLVNCNFAPKWSKMVLNSLEGLQSFQRNLSYCIIMSKYSSKPRQPWPCGTCVSNPTMVSMHSQSLGLWKQPESFSQMPRICQHSVVTLGQCSNLLVNIYG